jgi:hypothetical protein
VTAALSTVTRRSSSPCSLARPSGVRSTHASTCTLLRLWMGQPSGAATHARKGLLTVTRLSRPSPSGREPISAPQEHPRAASFDKYSSERRDVRF